MSTDAERRDEARKETMMDAFDAIAVVCDECGEKFDPQWVRASHVDPGYAAQDTCPFCGSDHWHER